MQSDMRARLVEAATKAIIGGEAAYIYQEPFGDYAETAAASVAVDVLDAILTILAEPDEAMKTEGARMVAMEFGDRITAADAAIAKSAFRAMLSTITKEG